jgi:hypothetical protein
MAAGCSGAGTNRKAQAQLSPVLRTMVLPTTSTTTLSTTTLPPSTITTDAPAPSTGPIQPCQGSLRSDYTFAQMPLRGGTVYLVSLISDPAMGSSSGSDLCYVTSTPQPSAFPGLPPCGAGEGPGGWSVGPLVYANGNMVFITYQNLVPCFASVPSASASGNSG